MRCAEVVGLKDLAEPLSYTRERQVVNEAVGRVVLLGGVAAHGHESVIERPGGATGWRGP